VVGMSPPVLGRDLGQLWIPDHQEILAVLRVRGDRPIVGAGDDESPFHDHDFVVRPFMPRIEGHDNSSRHQA
jgi:hypothetical protein